MVDLHLRSVGLAAGMVGLQSRSGSGNQNGGSAPLKSESDNQSGGSTLEKSWSGAQVNIIKNMSYILLKYVVVFITRRVIFLVDYHPKNFDFKSLKSF